MRRAAPVHVFGGDDRRALRRGEKAARMRRAVSSSSPRAPARAPLPARAAISCSSRSGGQISATGPYGGVSARAHRAAHVGRGVVARVQPVNVLADRARHLLERAPENRLRVQEAPVLPADQHEQRRAGDARGIERAHAVAEPGRDVQIDDAEPARRARVAVGHRHRCDLGQRDDVADLLLALARAHERNLGRPGIAEDHFDAVSSRASAAGIRRLSSGGSSDLSVGVFGRVRPHLAFTFSAGAEACAACRKPLRC